MNKAARIFNRIESFNYEDKKSDLKLIDSKEQSDGRRQRSQRSREKS